MAAPVNRAMLLGDDAIPTAPELDRYAEAGVRAFLAAYARPHGSDRPPHRVAAYGAGRAARRRAGSAS